MSEPRKPGQGSFYLLNTGEERWLACSCAQLSLPYLILATISWRASCWPWIHLDFSPTCSTRVQRRTSTSRSLETRDRAPRYSYDLEPCCSFTRFYRASSSHLLFPRVMSFNNPIFSHLEKAHASKDMTPLTLSRQQNEKVIDYCYCFESWSGVRYPTKDKFDAQITLEYASLVTSLIATSLSGNHGHDGDKNFCYAHTDKALTVRRKEVPTQAVAPWFSWYSSAAHWPAEARDLCSTSSRTLN